MDEKQSKELREAVERDGDIGAALARLLGAAENAQERPGDEVRAKVDDLHTKIVELCEREHCADWSDQVALCLAVFGRCAEERNGKPGTTTTMSFAGSKAGLVLLAKYLIAEQPDLLKLAAMQLAVEGFARDDDDEEG